jgi:hypothetical protein
MTIRGMREMSMMLISGAMSYGLSHLGALLTVGIFTWHLGDAF